MMSVVGFPKSKYPGSKLKAKKASHKVNTFSDTNRNPENRNNSITGGIISGRKRIKLSV